VGVFAWPEERGELADAIAGALVERVDDRSQRGRVVAVMGARGGAGTTFLSSNLASTFAGRGIRCAVVDLDASFADITVALGVGAEERTRTIADLVPVMHELSPEHLEDALYRHPAGFHALLAPAEPDADQTVPLGLYSASIALLAGSFEIVLLHVPRTIDAAARLAIDLADEVLLVVTLDLFSLFGARRLMAALGLRERAAGCRVIVNRLARQEVTLGDVERVLDVSASAVVRFDPVVKRMQARGQLLSTKSRRAGRDLRVLARLLASDWGREHEKGAPEVGAQLSTVDREDIKVQVRSRLLSILLDLERLSPPERRLRVRDEVVAVLREERAILPASDVAEVVNQVSDEVVGLGPIERLLKDPEVSDVKNERGRRDEAQPPG
jgi:pilus assembly protein CpaE